MTSSSTKKRLTPLSIRPKDDTERNELLRRAGNMPFSAWAKSVLLDAPVQRFSPSITLDKAVIAKLLAFLGSSRMAANLDVLAGEARAGNLLLNETNSAMLKQACADVSEMRLVLLCALGRQAKLNAQVGVGRSDHPIGAVSVANKREI